MPLSSRYHPPSVAAHTSGRSAFCTACSRLTDPQPSSDARSRARRSRGVSLYRARWRITAGSKVPPVNSEPSPYSGACLYCQRAQPLSLVVIHHGGDHTISGRAPSSRIRTRVRSDRTNVRLRVDNISARFAHIRPYLRNPCLTACGGAPTLSPSPTGTPVRGARKGTAMTKSKAVKLGSALVAAGVLESARPGTEPGAATAQVQGSAVIDGYWAGRNAKASIICEHVAIALLNSGRWTVEAIRACRHDFDGAWYVQPHGIKRIGA